MMGMEMGNKKTEMKVGRGGYKYIFIVVHEQNR